MNGFDCNARRVFVALSIAKEIVYPVDWVPRSLKNRKLPAMGTHEREGNTWRLELSAKFDSNYE